ncbi:MAG TPA: hypothetical protein VK813_10475 [Edaphobacter sp.]|jgi:hypothetical protein|nr:hypothetical protein [Edaphobacter sp.]
MRRLFVIASLALLTQVGTAQNAARRKPLAPLNDAALDQVTAAGGGGITAGLANGVITFQGSVPTKNGLVSGAGTLAVLTGPSSTTLNQGTLTLNGQAQQNLSSLININAVNSNINVLLNLNVNINSTVGTLTQTNMNGKH